jgi:hypothetical protein
MQGGFFLIDDCSIAVLKSSAIKEGGIHSIYPSSFGHTRQVQTILSI